ncbi:MAG: PQQ-binding-like beta-propeller repeat protein [Gemmataceae bacterium]|nr:PQQ-binding-like beta-propeller repeat protein [Gemmataceae bacterium]
MHKTVFGLGLLVGCCWMLSDDPEAEAANWARFRGPNGTGVATDTEIPVEFGTEKGVVWKVPTTGVGNSSPIVWGDNIFLETATPDGKERALVCLSTKDGKPKWTKSISSSKGKTHPKNSLASGTPATDGERIYAPFWDGKNVFLYAFDFKGNKLWDRDLGAFESQHGAGSSPVVHGDKVFYNHDQDGAAVIIALDAKNGKTAWEKKRKAFRTCYSTPFILERTDGGAELVVASTAGLTGYNPADGVENWNWVWDFKPAKPLRTVGSPIVSNGLVLAGSGDGDGTRHLVAVKLGGKGDISKDALAWDKRKGSAYVPTMLAAGDHIYYVNDNGMAGCYSAKNGEEPWSERLGGSFSASPLLIDGKVYAFAEDGNVFVFAAAPKYQLLAKNVLGEVIFATPAVADNRLYIRTKSNLYCIGKK